MGRKIFGARGNGYELQCMMTGRGEGQSVYTEKPYNIYRCLFTA